MVLHTLFASAFPLFPGPRDFSREAEPGVDRLSFRAGHMDPKKKTHITCISAPLFFLKIEDRPR